MNPLLLAARHKTNTPTGGSVIGDITSKASEVGGDITSLGGGLVEEVTCEYSLRSQISPCANPSPAVGGKAFTIVTSAGGAAITLAGSAGGVLTTFGGQVFTAATQAAADVTSKANSAVGAPSSGFTSAHVIGLATVVCSALVGAIVTL